MVGAPDLPGVQQRAECVDFCLAWNWEGDADFAALTETACRSHGLSMLHATSENLQRILQGLRRSEIRFRSFMDRASDTDSTFAPLVKWSQEHEAHFINRPDRALRASDKATMHLELIRAGLQTPYSLVLPPYVDEPEPPPFDLTQFKTGFVIKPACGGGGEGVVVEATGWTDVLAARQEHPADKYLLQARVAPRILGGRPAWFRVIHAAGHTYPCWWHPSTHEYDPVSLEEETRWGLAELRRMAVTIAAVSGLDLFSTEVAIAADGPPLVVDYVNDQIDLRLRSKAADGVPDGTVIDAADSLVRLVADRCTRAS